MVLDNIEQCWWLFLKQEERLELADDVEGGLFKLAENVENNEVKSAVFQVLLSVFVSKSAQDYFYKLWETNGKFYGLKPSGTDYSTIALALSLRDYPGSDSILNEQLSRD
jgi:aminopeptidase N